MKMRLLCLLPILPLCVHLGAAPDWAKEDSKVELPPELIRGKDACFVRYESEYRILPSGDIEVTSRGSIRVLSRTGAIYANGFVSYIEDRDKLHFFRGWLITPGKKERRADKHEQTEITPLGYLSLASDYKLRVLPSPEFPADGATFSYESKVTYKEETLETSFMLHPDLPTYMGRASVSGPPGWDAVGKELCAGAPPATIRQGGPNGQIKTWSWSAVSAPRQEPLTLGADRENPALHIKFKPPPGAMPAGKWQVITWPEQVQHECKWDRTACVSDAAVRAEALRVAGNSENPWERVRNLATMVQHMRYISRADGTHGRRAEPPPLVLKRGFGDCHDKAMLLKVMLQEIGVRAHIVLVHATDPSMTDPGWASTFFNHAIVGIEPPADWPEAPTVDMPGLGRLVIFDATQPYLPLGFIPQAEQGGYVLAVAPQVTGVAPLPIENPEVSRLSLKTELKLDARRNIEARITLSGKGTSASDYRTSLDLLSKGDFERFSHDAFSTTVSQPKLKLLGSQDDFRTGDIRLDVEVRGTLPGNSAYSPVLVIDPRLLKADRAPKLDSAPRRRPVRLDATCSDEEVLLQIPEGAQVEDLPAPVHIDSNWGSYSLVFDRVDGAIRLRRNISVRKATVPAAQAAELKIFLDRIAKSDGGRILVKMPPR